MTSRLVETVMINVEDFAESFLTCGTCLCGYDASEHSPKLLPCSHTVCRTCLERILETQVRGDAFRCPICREGITVPRGGATAFPPAFIVNQLLDLLASQRRNLVPKCSIHPAQELLFCETCDKVFCAECTDGGHHEPGALAHNVITFNVAIKRCSEILLYKAHLCIQQLNSAHESVREELDRLDENTNSCIGAINEGFEEVKMIVQKRHRELLHQVRKISDDKRHSLSEQLSLIESERDIVRRECDQLNYQVDVRSISKGISYLNEKLDKVGSLAEPRENAYIRYFYKQNSAMLDMVSALATLGRINTSTTYPSLCVARISPAVLNLNSQVVVKTVDYHGDPRRTGGDPVLAEVTEPSGRSSLMRVEDRADGSYHFRLKPVTPGRHKLTLRILDRPIRDSPFQIDVAPHQTPLWTCSKGPDDRGFVQPFALVAVNERLFVLDTGNSRVVVVESEGGRATSQLGGEAMAGQAGTGVALSRDEEGLWLVNWRSRQVSLVDINTDQIVQQLSSKDLVEPTSVTLSTTTGEVYVADNGAGRVLSWDPRVPGGAVRKVTGPGQVKRVTGLSMSHRDELVLAGSGLQMISRDGRLLTELWSGPRSQFGGVHAGRDCLLVTRTERARSVVQVLPWPASSASSPSSGVVAVVAGAMGGDRSPPLPLQLPVITPFEIDAETRLKRPAGLISLETEGEVVVADAGMHRVIKLRYS